MGERSSKPHKGKKRKQLEEPSSSSSPSSSPSSSDEGEPYSKKRRHKRSGNRRSRDERRRSDGGSRRKRREKEKSSEREKRGDRERKHRRSRLEGKRKASDSESSVESESSGDDNSRPARRQDRPENLIVNILKEFPDVAGDLEQLLQMIDDGQAVDIRGLSERSLIKHLKKLFQSLRLKENGDKVFLLPSNVCPTLEVVGPIIRSSIKHKRQQLGQAMSPNDIPSLPLDNEIKEADDNDSKIPCPMEEITVPRRRTIGPEVPSAELLAAAAKLTEAEAELRAAELEEDTGVFIGPPPPAMVKEAESANEAERFEEVTRIMGIEVDSPYDVVGVNSNMSADNIKRRYWKLSLIVHPDKCSHPQAHQAFIKLNKAFKDLQDPAKRKVLDDKIRLKEEQEEFKKELKALREAAHWRRLQGISMEGDDELLAEMEVKVIPKRDEWMTSLPPERKPGTTMQTTKFSRSSKEGRGDTSAWTDSPSDKAQKAKMNYLEAYNEASALASNEQEKTSRNADAELVDKYNKAKRSKSLVEKHNETVRNHSKKKSKREAVKQAWEGEHPWKPWDREKDLAGGRQNVKFDSKDMAQGLSSKFSSGTFQRNFL